MESHFHTLILYFSAHPWVALAAVFAGAALEALAVIGIVVPGSMIVFMGGVLIGMHILSPVLAALAAIIGAISGDGVSYWLGQHYRERLRSVWPMKRYPALFSRGETYFAANGGKSVFLGRFFGPLRAIVPVIAGMSGMPPLQFTFMNVTSAVAWAGVLILPGVLFGASLQIAGALSSRLVILLLGIAIVIWLLHRTTHYLMLYGWPHIEKLRDRAVKGAHRGSGFFSKITLSLFDPARPESRALLTAAILLIAGAWLFGGIVQDVMANDPIVQFDQAVNSQMQNLRTDWGDHVMVALTEVGGPAGTIALIVTLSLYFAYRRYWRTLGYWIAAVSVAEVLVWVVKFTLGRARPHNIYTGIEQYSFPSGHTTLSIVVYGFMAFLLANGKPTKKKVALTLTAATVIVLISISRIYLGVHWFSDVIGSLSLGMIWVALLSIAFTHHVKNQRLPILPFFTVVLATLAIVSTFYYGDRHADDIRRYAYQVTVLKPIILDDWAGDGWRRLPTARAELEGDIEEPFAIQWSGTTVDVLTARLATVQWHARQPWGIKTALLWLLPTTPIESMPVLPKLDHGLAQQHTLVKELNRNERLVIRLWRSSYAQQTTACVEHPLWFGSVLIERRQPLSNIVTLLIAEHDFRRPVELLQNDLERQPGSFQKRERDQTDVLLISQ
ncbi:phosphatase PAP2 family protein [Massilia sp. TWR1-2-2]|uniref:bifunctional DedA family/phosphatase PAP2 family protein n=1 Tax=Massilia sp. TWR1-2-2 TaxID=2804584 RepID=UPI003CF05293